MNGRIISIVQLEDGRYGVQNEGGVADLTHEDLQQMWNALRLWFTLRDALIKEAGAGPRKGD